MKWFCLLIRNLHETYRKFMSNFILPTKENGEIDSNYVSCVYILISGGKKYIHCVVGGQILYLFHSDKLEAWFVNSKFVLATVNQDISLNPKHIFNVSEDKINKLIVKYK